MYILCIHFLLFIIDDEYYVSIITPIIRRLILILK